MITKKGNVRSVKIISDKENPEPLEVVVSAIIAVSDAFAKMQNSKLKQRAVVLLIKDQCKSVSLEDIEKILDIVPKLKDIYLKK